MGVRAVFYDPLPAALVEDIFPASSAKCVGDGTTTFTSTFYWRNESDWDEMSKNFEPQAFLVEMAHTDININKTWTARVSHGGGIYSFVAWGQQEIMPPQQHDLAPWIDEVWQMVAVDQTLNGDPAMFIHQAGTYQKEDTLLERPFYSPNTAMHCEDRTCGFASWGQNAHVPTPFYNSMIYYTRYKDCGDGVMETTYAMHNAGAKDEAYTFSYFNVPWAGVRTSALQDMMLPPSNGGDAEVVEPLNNWGGDGLKNLNAHGGYTTFAENVFRASTEFDVPCGDGTGAVVACTDDDSTERMVLQIKSDNNAAESAGHTSAWGVYTVKVNIVETVDLGTNGCQSCPMTFTNTRTNGTVIVKGVLHWANSGTRMFFWPEGTAADFNNVFAAGDFIAVSYYDSGRRIEDNRAFSWVYGKDKESTEGTDWWTRNARIRYGLGGTMDARDYTVWTINVFPRIVTGETYYYRHYTISDDLTNMNDHARDWLDEPMQTYSRLGDIAGRDVYLFTKNNRTYGAGMMNDSCAQIMCSGKTTPQVDMLPYFYVVCGDNVYTGPDMYAFTPDTANFTRDSGIKRPWLCDGLADTVRPTWTLLGYFPTTPRCAALETALKVDFFCKVASNITFTTVVEYYYASTNYFMSNAAVQLAACSVTAAAAGLLADDCTFVCASYSPDDPTCSDQRRLETIEDEDERRRLALQPVYVTTIISTDLFALQYTDDEIQAAFAYLSGQISIAISSGTFLTMFQTYATNNGLAVPPAFSISDVFFEADFEILYPSSAPSSYPTSAPSYTGGSNAWGQTVWDGSRRVRRHGKAICDNDCSGHGTCDFLTQQDCQCYTNMEGEAEWVGPDCSQHACPRDYAWVANVAVGANDMHPWVECSNKGVCNRETGECECFVGYEGTACQRTSCPQDCNNRGTCRPQQRLAASADRVYDTPWDARKHVGCVCDIGYRGPACELQECRSGADPLGGFGNEAGRDCSGRGLCDYSTGLCSCFSGFYGPGCEVQAELE